MELGFVGLGRMGLNMVRRLQRDRHRVIVWDRAAEPVKEAIQAGAIWGLKIGYCLMVGGDEAVVRRLAPIFTTLSPENGWARMGGVGAGHYVKMIHNGIEYGMMQAYAEGFELMSKSDYGLDLPAI